MERRTRRRPDYAPAAAQRPAHPKRKIVATAQNFAAPIWMTFRQALELDAHVRKGEQGSLVVYANSITRTEQDEKSGEDVEREIPYMKGYTVFNVEQIDGLPEILLRQSPRDARSMGLRGSNPTQVARNPG